MEVIQPGPNALVATCEMLSWPSGQLKVRRSESNERSAVSEFGVAVRTLAGIVKAGLQACILNSLELLWSLNSKLFSQSCNLSTPYSVQEKLCQEHDNHLLLLGTSTSSLLGQLDALLVGLDLALTLLQSTHHTGSGLPWTLEVSARWLAKKVDLDQVALESAFERDDGLDEEWVGVLEVDVHDTHHAESHQLRLEETLQLLLIVCVDGGGNSLWLLGAAHRRRLDVLEDGHV